MGRNRIKFHAPSWSFTVSLSLLLNLRQLNSIELSGGSELSNYVCEPLLLELALLRWDDSQKTLLCMHSSIFDFYICLKSLILKYKVKKNRIYPNINVSSIHITYIIIWNLVYFNSRFQILFPFFADSSPLKPPLPSTCKK